MIDPVSQSDLLMAGLSGAFVILGGAGYALFFSSSKVYHKPKLMLLAYLSYAIFCVAVWGLSVTLNLFGYWQILVWLMIAGYFFAPHAIWHLCIGTHSEKPFNQDKQLPGGIHHE